MAYLLLILPTKAYINLHFSIRPQRIWRPSIQREELRVQDRHYFIAGIGRHTVQGGGTLSHSGREWNQDLSHIFRGARIFWCPNWTNFIWILWKILDLDSYYNKSELLLLLCYIIISLLWNIKVISEALYTNNATKINLSAEKIWTKYNEKHPTCDSYFWTKSPEKPNLGKLVQQIWGFCIIDRKSVV